MSNKTQLSTNNTQLASLIQELANKAAGGGSGGSVETCTVTVKSQSGNMRYYLFTTFADGQIGYNYRLEISGKGEFTVENVICGSPFYINDIVGIFDGISTDGDISIIAYGNNNYFFQAPSSAGEYTMTIKAD